MISVAEMLFGVTFKLKPFLGNETTARITEDHEFCFWAIFAFLFYFSVRISGFLITLLITRSIVIICLLYRVLIITDYYFFLWLK